MQTGFTLEIFEELSYLLLNDKLGKYFTISLGRKTSHLSLANTVKITNP